MTEKTPRRLNLYSFTKGLVLAALAVTAVSFAQVPGLGGGADLTGAARQDPGGSVHAPNLGNLPSLPPPGMWNSPLLADQRPYFEAINETTYVVGPGDYFHVGVGAQVFNLAVSPEGYLFLESVPPVHVDKLTLLEARQLLIEAASGHFQGDKVHVHLAQAKRFQVIVSGAANWPGIFGVDPGARVSNLLEIVGGYSVRSTREIILHRATGEVDTVDLRGFYLEGDMSANPVVRQGDRLVFPSLELNDSIVYVRAESNLLSMRYRDDETLEEFVLRFDGFRNAREWRYARIYDASGHYVTTVQREESGSYVMQSGTTVELHAPKAMVFVGGMVMRPGFFQYNPTLSAMDYLGLAGMTPYSGNPRRLTVVNSHGEQRYVSPTVPLNPGDHVLVPRSYERTLSEHIALMAAIASLAIGIATLVQISGNN